MKVIDQSGLIALLNEIKGATFATLITETDARLKKTGNPFGPVTKVSRVNVTLGTNYEAAVNRQRTREGSEADFKAMPRQWGERIDGTSLVAHKGKTYLETVVNRSLEAPIYRDAAGSTLTAEQVAPFLPARSKGRQEVEREVVVRDFALDSILSITVGGESYVLLRDAVPASIPAALAV